MGSWSSEAPKTLTIFESFIFDKTLTCCLNVSLVKSEDPDLNILTATKLHDGDESYKQSHFSFNSHNFT